MKKGTAFRLALGAGAIYVVYVGSVFMDFLNSLNVARPARSQSLNPGPISQPGNAERAPAKPAPIVFKDLKGEWVSDYGGVRKLALSGTMTNERGEPLQYECNSHIVVYLQGKDQTYESESELQVTGCGDPGRLAIGKTRNISNWAYDRPFISAEILQYTIEEVEWSFQVSAKTPLGETYSWTVATATIPLPSERRKFSLLGSPPPGRSSSTPPGSEGSESLADDPVRSER